MDFLCGEFLVKGEPHLCDEFGGVFTDDVRAEQFAVFFAVEQFGESFGFAGGDGLADGDKRNFAHFVFNTGFLECALGFSDRCNLRMAIGAAREIRHLAWLVAGNIEALDRLHGFKRCGVRQPWRAGDVASGIHAGNRGFIAIADIDETALRESGLDAAGKHRLDADGHQADFRADGAVFLRSFER